MFPSLYAKSLVCCSLICLFLFLLHEEADTKKKLLRLMPKSILFMFYSRSVIVSGLIFKYLIHFKYYFWIWCEKVVHFAYLAWTCPVFPTPFIEKAISSHCNSCLYHRLTIKECFYLLVSSLYNVLLCLVTVFVLISTFPDVGIAGFLFVSICMEYLFPSLHFQSVSLNLKWLSRWQHFYGSWFLSIKPLGVIWLEHLVHLHWSDYW